MSRMFRKALADRGLRNAITLVDRNLHRFIQAQVRQVKSAFKDDSVFPEPSHQDCNCDSSGISHRGLARNIKANKTGWQNELAQSLLLYVISHLSASIVNNVYEALAVDQPLNWRGFTPCDVRQNRNNPSFVLEAAGRAILARIMLRSAALRGCVITGAFLNVIKRHWLGCEWFRGAHKGSFPEHEYLHHELLKGAIDTYLEQPTQETFELASDTLRWSLAALPCPLKNLHPNFHQAQRGPAAESLGDTASLPSKGT